MHLPEMAVRVEICRTDADTLKEWRVVLGGSQRGGLSSRHGYMPTSGPLLMDSVDEILDGIRVLLEAYASGLSALQLELDWE